MCLRMIKLEGAVPRSGGLTPIKLTRLVEASFKLPGHGWSDTLFRCSCSSLVRTKKQSELRRRQQDGVFHDNFMTAVHLCDCCTIVNELKQHSKAK